MAKWTVLLEVEVTAESVGEAREKAIGPFGNLNSCDRIKRLEFERK